MYKKYIKRFFDVIMSFFALIILSPILLIIALMVKIKLGSPIIFSQERPGKDEKLFKIYKFRSMTEKKDENGDLLPDIERLTKFGAFLRKTSLDEIPEFFNILKGDMSLVGPRPLRVSYLKYYNEEEKHRHDVRPGLTGLAQVNGRSSLNWDKRFKYDIEYINNISFINDMKIILKTVFQVFKTNEVITRGTGKIVDFNTYRKNQCKEIGNDFWEYDTSKEYKDIEIIKNAKIQCLFQSGRNAIKALCKNIDFSENKKILLPSYTGDGVIKTFIDENLEVYFYEINRDFTINEKNFLDKIEKINPAAILIQSYFGFDTLKDSHKLIDKIKQKHIIIEDISHNWISKIRKTDSPYYIASLRKWFAIPNGGVLISKDKNIDIVYDVEDNSELTNTLVKAYNLKKEYYEYKNEKMKKKYKEIYNKAKDIISDNSSIVPMSKMSKKILANVNFEEISKIRRENYAYLYENLNNKYENINVIRQINDSEIPLYFPIYVKNRNEFTQRLIENQIYCSIIWPKSKYMNEMFGETEYIYENILCIPCDQRYNLNDMKRIIESIEKINTSLSI